jgi:hypothetical protein
MDSILGIVVCICLYLALSQTRYFWRQYRAEGRILNDKIDGQMFVSTLFFFCMVLILVMEMVTQKTHV